MSSYYPGGAPTATGRAPVKAKPKSRAAPSGDGLSSLAGMLGSPGYDPALLRSQATQQAKADIAAQLAAYHSEQNAATAAARRNAAQILAATKTAAKFLTPLADQTARDYQNAVANQQGIAQGFTGLLRDDAQAAADAAAAKAVAAGGSAGQIHGQGASLANLLYGLSGKLPTDVLQVEGLGATAAARALPASTLGYGQQEAVGAIGAGQQAAAQYQPDIAKALASRPALEQQYLSQFQDAARQAQQDQLSNAFRLLSAQQAQQRLTAPRVAGLSGGGLYSYDPTTGQVQILREPQLTPTLRSIDGGIVQVNPDGSSSVVYQEPKQPKITQVGGDVVSINPDGTVTRLYKGANSKAASKPQRIGSAATGYSWLYPDGRIVPLQGKYGKPSAGAYKIPVSVLNRAQTMAERAFNGGKTIGSGGLSLDLGGQDRVPYKTVLRQVRAYFIASGVPKKLAGPRAKQILLGVGYTPPVPGSGIQGVSDYVSGILKQLQP